MRWYVGNVYKEEKMNGNIEYKRLIKKSGKQMVFRLLHALNFDSELVNINNSLRERSK